MDSSRQLQIKNWHIRVWCENCYFTIKEDVKLCKKTYKLHVFHTNHNHLTYVNKC